MATPVSLDDQIIRGHKAARLMEDELLQEGFRALRDHYVRLAWDETAPTAVEAREELRRCYDAVKRVEEVFYGWIDTGKIAADKIKHQGLLGKLKSVI